MKVYFILLRSDCTVLNLWNGRWPTSSILTQVIIIFFVFFIYCFVNVWFLYWIVYLWSTKIIQCSCNNVSNTRNKFLLIIHTFRVHYAHTAANLNSGYSRYAKVARVHYFCTIALRISREVLTRAWASHRVDLFSKRVIIFCRRYFDDF